MNHLTLWIFWRNSKFGECYVVKIETRGWNTKCNNWLMWNSRWDSCRHMSKERDECWTVVEDGFGIGKVDLWPVVSPIYLLYWKLFSIGKIHHNLSHLSSPRWGAAAPAPRGRSQGTGGFELPTRAPGKLWQFHSSITHILMSLPWLREVEVTLAEMPVRSPQTGWEAP